MKQKVIDFRELLERILPVDDLMPMDRLQVRRALQNGVTEQLESAALLALTRLEQRGVLRRVPDTGGAPSLRYEARDALAVITLPLPASENIQGVTCHRRATLPAQRQASLDQVRRLLNLDDLILFSDPRRSDVRGELGGWLVQAGREFLPTSAVMFVAVDEAARGESFDGGLSALALSDPASIFYCPDVARAEALAATGRARGVGSVAAAAMKDSEGTVFGCLEVTSASRDAFGPEDLSMIALLADHAAGVLERAARIEKLMFMDPMTAVYNRSYFDLQLQNEVARARRESSSMALCIVDIDDFKSFNTQYGYEAGNLVLTSVARALRTGVRPFDTVSRWGGEEFGVLLTAPVLADDVRTICERLRTMVGRLEVEVTGLDRAPHTVQVTVSMGVAVFPDHGLTPDDLWRAANQALLIAKRPPKDQVIFFAAHDAP